MWITSLKKTPQILKKNAVSYTILRCMFTVNTKKDRDKKIHRNKHMKSKLLSRNEVSELLSVKSETVRKWQQRGKLKVHCTINGRPRYSTEDIEKLIIKKEEK